MFFITSRTDSGIDLPNLDLTDEKLLAKYGSDLTANFADIRAYGSKAFFQKENVSNGATYSLCACATGYIWVSVSTFREAARPGHFSDVEVQIGTFALKSRAITTIEIPCMYKYSDEVTPMDGQLALLCATVLAKYLRLRIMGQQYEAAAETATSQSRQELSSRHVIDGQQFQDFSRLLSEVCANAPMPPTSDVSLISRKMITRRWECWRDSSVLRRRYFFPKRVLRCFQATQHDSIDLLSETFKSLRPQKTRVPILGA
jgi:hypothetical protein